MTTPRTVLCCGLVLALTGARGVPAIEVADSLAVLALPSTC
jgi:hypothetical protein